MWLCSDRSRLSYNMANQNLETARYEELLSEGLRYASRAAFCEAMDWHRAAQALCEAIALRPEEPMAYFNLGTVLASSGHEVESAPRFLEAMGRFPAGSEPWAKAASSAFHMLTEKACAEAAKPEWWSDEGLKALSLRVVEAAPNYVKASKMRAVVLDGRPAAAWAVGPRSSAELKEAASYYDQVRVRDRVQFRARVRARARARARARVRVRNAEGLVRAT